MATTEGCMRPRLTMYDVGSRSGMRCEAVRTVATRLHGVRGWNVSEITDNPPIARQGHGGLASDNQAPGERMKTAAAHRMMWRPRDAARLSTQHGQGGNRGVPQTGWGGGGGGSVTQDDGDKGDDGFYTSHETQGVFGGEGGAEEEVQ